MSTRMGNALDAPFVATVSTHLQIKPHEGPTGIVRRSYGLRPHREDGPAEIIRPGEWTKQAKCLGDWEQYAGAYEPRPRTAREMCAGCPFDTDTGDGTCLRTALEEEGRSVVKDRGGIRGGRTPGERFALARLVGKCSNGHDLEEHGAPRSGDRVYCLKCNRERDRGRDRIPVDCPDCGVEVVSCNLQRHRRTSKCIEARKESA